MEGLAAATYLDAQVCLSTESPKQQTALAAEHLPALTREARDAEPQTRTPAPDAGPDPTDKSSQRDVSGQVRPSWDPCANAVTSPARLHSGDGVRLNRRLLQG